MIISENEMYILPCIVILNFHYGFNLDFKRPFFYDIPDANGVLKHYRILYNADFMEILPTEHSKELSQDDVDELLENFENVALWKEKIPLNSFISKGFVIANMFDVTAEHSISEIKSSLIANDKRGSDNFMGNLHETFKSFFNLHDLNVGFTAYNTKEKQFERVHGKGMNSVILRDVEASSCEEALCPGSYKSLLEDSSYFAVSDVDKYFKVSEGMAPYKNLKEEGYKSAIYAPISDVLELTSTKKGALNSVNANKLDDIMPYIVTAVLRSKIEEENLIDAIIQNECTSVHESVYWKFHEEAKKFIKDDLKGIQPSFKEIVFKDVSPLYGQIDINK